MDATYSVRSFGVPRSFVCRSTFWLSVSTSSFVRPASNSAASTASDFTPLASYAAPLSAPSDRIPNSMTASSGAVPTDAVDVTVIVRGGVGADAGLDPPSPASAFAPNPTTSPTTNTSAIHPVRFIASSSRPASPDMCRPRSMPRAIVRVTRPDRVRFPARRRR